MRIFIDNVEADLDQTTNVAISLSVASHSNLEASKTGYAKTITIPMTQNNRTIMGDSEQLNATASFNRKEHTVRVEQDGFTVIEGIPKLIEANCGDDTGYYKINVVGAGMKWVKYAAETPLKALDMDFAANATAETVRESWTWNKPVRFLPVMRDGYEPENVNNDLFGVQKILTFEDYHPFLNIKQIVAKVFDDAGYTLQSKFMSEALFGSLYMSGNYPAADTAKIKSQMDFRAGRFAAATAKADYLGRVYANPYSNVNSLGNIVETADPNETNNGSSVAGVYAVDYCFRKNGMHMEFVPPTGVTLGFEYALYYTTDYRIKNRSQLTGFDTVYIGGGQQKKFTLANRFEDRRGAVENGKSYKIAIFDFDAAATYRPFYKVITNPAADPANLKPGDYVEEMGAVIGARLQPYVFSAAGDIAGLVIKEYKSSAYVEYTGDWALYDGYVEETGAVDVEIKLRSAAERVVPSQPKIFYDIWFGGASQGMSMALGKQTTIRPVFAQGVGEGAAVDFAKVANHTITCLDLINALKQMFNLYFLTDQLTKTVYVEPRKDFYTDNEPIDWSGRVDFSKPVAISDPGADAYRNIIFGYAPGDDAVATWNRANEDAFGKWQAAVKNTFAKDGTRNYENPVFTASISRKDALNTAPSALLMHAGGYDDGDVNFPPKIVRYMGMADLPQSESWGWPADTNAYPLMAFHYHGDSNAYEGNTPNPLSTFSEDKATLIRNGFSLCFEDRDGVAGIHRFWDGNIEILNEGKRVEMHLALYPEDIEAMLSPNTLGRDFRASYRLTIDGESVLMRLEEICDYNPAGGGSTKCVFIKEF